MDILESVRHFRSSSEQSPTVWKLGELSALGSLGWRAGKPELSLVVEFDLAKLIETKSLEHPLLEATELPGRPNIIAPISRFDTLFLEHCFRSNVQQRNNYALDTATCQLTMIPSRIWLGVPPEPDGEPIRVVNLWDSRLAGFFCLPGFDSYILPPAEHPQLFAALGNPEEVWSFKSEVGEPVPLGKTGFTLRRATRVSGGMSATTGYFYNSVSLLIIEPPPNASRHACEDIVHQLRNLLTVLAFEDFAFEAETYASENHTATIAWELGGRGSSFQPPLSHQILADISDVSILRTAADRWFETSGVVRLARWLYCKAVRETEDGLARFITVAQALEVLARELSPTTKLVDDTMRKAAVNAVREALVARGIPSDYSQRIVGLVQNSNATSYADALREMMQPVEAVILPVAKLCYPDLVHSLADFAKLIKDTRNAVVHMTSDKRDDLDLAFTRVNKLSLLISFCFAVIQAHQLGLPLDRAHEFLLNNRTLRHGLPNDFLESLGVKR